MLAEAIIRIGRPLAQSPMKPTERIRWLTDVDNENCKNYFQNVWVVELAPEEVLDTLHYMQLGEWTGEGKNAVFEVDARRSTSFPFHFPNGGNPLKAQGIYPLPCYLMWDAHIKEMQDPGTFAAEVLMPRLSRTVPYFGADESELGLIARRVSNLLAKECNKWSNNERQLGILMIVDPELKCFRYEEQPGDLTVQESGIRPGTWIVLDSETTLAWIREAKVREATELGEATDQISTFTNRRADRVVSLYNKSWLWLAPTWEMPRSIYWKDDEWTKGIKADPESYEYFYYGTQFMKAIQVPVSSTTLKEMFAPVMHAEARKHIRASSYEQIYGIPMLLPLLDGDSEQQYRKYRQMLRPQEDETRSALHLRLLAGIDRFIPRSGDDYRLTILYYSGDLSRGNMHIRAVIEDVVPSVAATIQDIMAGIQSRDIPQLIRALGLPDPFVLHALDDLPSMLANAFGPGYVWDSLQKVLHRQPIRIERVHEMTARKCNDSAKQEKWHHVRCELLFYWAFLSFADQYARQIAGEEKGCKTVNWQQLLADYQEGRWQDDREWSVTELGFISGLLARQFENSYHKKVNSSYVRKRLLNFGSKLTPQMVWQNGLIEFQKLIEQRDLLIGKNFAPALARALLLFPKYQAEGLLDKHRHEFISTFWSGYLMYKKPDQEPITNAGQPEGGEDHDRSQQ
ncbi:MAG: hypothetical protein BAA01_00470 [Bacillus thermozeamaize]|uniref:Type I-C CRISPR-associated protein Cas8c/Csd1 n=1 Tax=Bacillus thermozeamaize TaxID=230954 RepID=A0A1Y3PHY4_9BACI|nr:MAG: hypothetical protein BAA01_00470 [Bacillus thermozeamaize]